MKRYIRTEVSTLNHEVLDDTVELGALVTETIRQLSAVLLYPGCQCTEVLNGLGDSLGAETR